MNATSEKNDRYGKRNMRQNFVCISLSPKKRFNGNLTSGAIFHTISRSCLIIQPHSLNAPACFYSKSRLSKQFIFLKFFLKFSPLSFHDVNHEAKLLIHLLRISGMVENKHYIDFFSPMLIDPMNDHNID